MLMNGVDGGSEIQKVVLGVVTKAENDRDPDTQGFRFTSV